MKGWRADFWCSPLKKGQQLFTTDEDDEEELPAGRIKSEDGVKVESDDDVTMKGKSDEE
jgi:hypothetical protein